MAEQLLETILFISRYTNGALPGVGTRFSRVAFPLLAITVLIALSAKAESPRPAWVLERYEITKRFPSPDGKFVVDVLSPRHGTERLFVEDRGNGKAMEVELMSDRQILEGLQRKYPDLSRWGTEMMKRSFQSIDWSKDMLTIGYRAEIGTDYPNLRDKDAGLVEQVICGSGPVFQKAGELKLTVIPRDTLGY